MSRYEIVITDDGGTPWAAELYETDPAGEPVDDGPLLSGAGGSVSAAVLDLLNAMEDDEQ